VLPTDVLRQLDEAIASAPAEARPGLVVALAARLATVGAGLVVQMPAKTEPASSNISVDEAAVRLGMSKDYIYRNADELPFIVRQGRRVLANAAALDKYIRTRTGRG
jgi:excisionase family DNA binding protein